MMVRQNAFPPILLCPEKAFLYKNVTVSGVDETAHSKVCT